MSTAPPAGKLRRPKHISDSSAGFFNALIYGKSGVGKTSLAATCPGPVLVIDCENGIASLRNPDPALVKQYSLELDANGNFKDLYYETVRTMDEMSALIARIESELASSPGFWGTIFLDSLTELQRICIMERLKSTKQILMEIQDWGVVLLKMEAVVRTLRGLNANTIFLAQEYQDEKGALRPELSGRISRQLIRHVDVLCRYTLFQKQEEGKGVEEIRKLRTREQFSPPVECKSRFHTLKDWEDPDIKNLIAKTTNSRSVS
jgi:hypothetical protein